MDANKLSEKEIRKIKVKMLLDEYESYKIQLMPYIRDEELPAVHERVVAEGHPKFVDVIVVRMYKLLMVRGTDIGDEVYQALVDGKSIEELVEEYDFAIAKETATGAVLQHSPDQWLRLHHADYLKKRAQSVAIGDSAGPRNFSRWAAYEKIIDKRVYPVVEMGSRLPGIDFNIEQQLRLIGSSNQRVELIERLFNEADIREDGVKVDNHVLPRRMYELGRPVCPRG